MKNKNKGAKYWEYIHFGYWQEMRTKREKLRRHNQIKNKYILPNFSFNFSKCSHNPRITICIDIFLKKNHFISIILYTCQGPEYQVYKIGIVNYYLFTLRILYYMQILFTICFYQYFFSKCLVLCKFTV